MKKLLALIVLSLLVACVQPVDEKVAVPAEVIEPTAVPEVPEVTPEATSVPVATPVETPEPVVNVTPEPVVIATPEPAGKTVEVSIESLKFNPETITIKKGDTVVWKNNDVSPHTVTVIQGPAPDLFDSNIIRKGQTFSHTFDIINTYYYKCSVSPVMRGKVVVEP